MDSKKNKCAVFRVQMIVFDTKIVERPLFGKCRFEVIKIRF